MGEVLVSGLLLLSHSWGTSSGPFWIHMESSGILGLLLHFPFLLGFTHLPQLLVSAQGPVPQSSAWLPGLFPESQTTCPVMSPLHHLCPINLHLPKSTPVPHLGGVVLFSFCPRIVLAQSPHNGDSSLPPSPHSLWRKLMSAAGFASPDTQLTSYSCPATQVTMLPASGVS